jgi:hypothetical protein
MKISRIELLSALEDRDAFYDLYVSVTNRAIDLCAKAGRRKFALKLHGSLAALDMYVMYASIQFHSLISYTVTVDGLK